MMLFFIISIPIIAFLASLLVRKSVFALNRITLVASILEFLASIAVVMAVIEKGTYSANAYLSVDALGAVLMAILAIVSTMVSWYSIGYLKVELKEKVIGFGRVREYFIFLHLFILAMFFAIMTTSPVFMWIAIEATTLSTAFLISFYNKPLAVEAAWKYLIINSVGLLLGFFGTLLFLYPAAHNGLQGVMNWQTLLSNVAFFDPNIAKIAFIFILIGFGTKVGLVPMHTWLPDAHSNAPAPISSLLSGVLLNVAFLAVLRFKSVVDLTIGREFSDGLLIFFGLASIVVAALIMFTQKDYKRLLAYSSIEHMGIASLGFGFGGASAFAALLHMIYHSLAKSTLFLSAGNIFLKYGSTKIENVKGVLSILPVTAILFIIGFLTITGVPPFGIFITEFSILMAGIKIHPFITVVALFALTLVFISFLRSIASMVFGESDTSIVKGESNIWTIMPVVILVVILVIVSFYIPSAFQSLLQLATKNY